MRNPKRIDPLIEELREFWKAHPDWRLGQLVENAYSYAGGRYAPDAFYMEDETFLEGLKIMREKGLL